MELVLARHAQTAANEQRQFCGLLDLPLSPAGELEARRTAQALKAGFDLVLTSGMRRTHQTGIVLAPDADMEAWPSLGEMDFGTFEGLTADEIQRAMPKQWADYIADPLTFTFPGGGNVPQYFALAEETVKTMIALPIKRLLVVSHKGWIAAALSALLHGDASRMFHYDIRPAGFATLNVTDGFAVLSGLQ